MSKQLPESQMELVHENGRKLKYQNYVSSTHKNIEEVLKERLGNCNYESQCQNKNR